MNSHSELRILDPTQDYPLQEVAINGVHFGPTQGTRAVHIEDTVYGPGNPDILFWSDTQIRSKMPNYTFPIGVFGFFAIHFGDRERRYQ